jgi:hypothetical protein
MTAHNPTSGDDEAEPLEPFEDDAERAEYDWLIARERDPAAAAPSTEIASEYAEIEKLLAALPIGAPDDGWQDEVLEQPGPVRRSPPARPSPIPWWRRKLVQWTMGGVGLAVAAAAGLILLLRNPQELDVSVHSGGKMRGNDEAAVGDQLVITARPSGPGDLRVYRSDGALVARCPGSTACTIRTSGEYDITVPLDAPVQYHVILVLGGPGAMPDGSLDTFLDAARAANAHIIRHRPIDVH